MKKKMLIFILMFVIFTPIITYALGLQTSANSESQEFFYTSNNQASPGDVITMSIDLSKIDYQSFEFSLTSSTNINNISTADENLSSTTENNKFKIISNKADVNMNKIDLYYKIPEDIAIGSKIIFEGTMQEYIDNTESEKDEGTAEKVESSEENDENVESSKESENSENITDSKSSAKYENIENFTVTESTENTEKNEVTSNTPASNTATITIEIVEKESSDKSEQGTFSENNQEANKTEPSNQGNNSNGQNTKPSTSSQMSSSKSTMAGVSNQETVTYEGDCNNYLESLSLEGYNLTPAFLKTNNTYFINIDSDVSSLNITAKAESDEAKVNIYGNNNLEDGENKILVFVTAENGDVRTYRIYATK